MDKVIGGVLGGAAFAAVVVVSVVNRQPFGTSAVRALAAFAVGGLVGWLLFGKVGLAIMREAAGKKEENGAPAEAPKAPGR
jgi:hypothetical protein